MPYSMMSKTYSTKNKMGFAFFFALIVSFGFMACSQPTSPATPDPIEAVFTVSPLILGGATDAISLKIASQQFAISEAGDRPNDTFVSDKLTGTGWTIVVGIIMYYDGGDSVYINITDGNYTRYLKMAHGLMPQVTFSKVTAVPSGSVACSPDLSGDDTNIQGF